MASSSSFNLRSKNFFLTYPQCPVHKQFALDLFKSKFSKTLDYALIAEEKHQDGEPHLHALLIFKKRQAIRNPKHFDITISSHSYHPNITKPRDVTDVLNYVGKDGDTVEFGTKPTLKPKRQSRELDFGEYLRVANSKEEFLQLVRNNYPYQYVLNLQRLEYFAAQTWPPAPAPHANQWTAWNNLPPEIHLWVQNELFVENELFVVRNLGPGINNFLEQETKRVQHIIDDKLDTYYLDYVERIYNTDDELNNAGSDAPKEEEPGD
nr:MAG: C1 replication-associated protein [Grapevine red blotch virus]